jgi:DNA-binding FadR family transcriptional regulator
VAEIYDIREFIEGLAARLLARRITHGQAQVLQELSVQADNPYATVEEDSAFHSAIIRLSGSWKVMEIAQSHCLQALTYDERMHRLAAGSHTPVIVEGRVPDAHQQIACAIISGNENEAERIVREHVGLGKSIVAKRLLGL